MSRATPDLFHARWQRMRAGFRPEIEGLRGLAVLAVVMYHAGVPGVGGGFTGVDVFFVLSGFLITGLLTAEREKTGQINVPAFYARRIRRLLPAAALLTIATLGMSFVIHSPGEQAAYAGTALAASLYLANIWFIRNTRDYFDAAAEDNPFLHMWSLAVEEQFYLIWPLFLLFALRFRGPGRLAWLGAVTGLSFAVSVILTSGDLRVVAFFSSPTRVWEFGLGGCLALLRTPGPDARRLLGRLASWGGVALILGSFILLDNTVPYPGVAALMPALGTIGLLAASTWCPSGVVARLLGMQPLVLLGTLSYSWYLWHWPALVFLRAIKPSAALGITLLVVLASLAIAWLSYRLVETPIRNAHHLTSSTPRSIGFGVGVTAILMFSAVGWRHGAGLAADTPAQRQIATALDDRAMLYEMDCISQDAEPKQCVFGDSAGGGRTVMLFGDSHAAHWFPALLDIAERNNFVLVTAIKSSCPAIDVPVGLNRAGRWPDECVAWRKRVMGRIRDLRPEVVVMSNYSGYVLREGFEGQWRQVNLDQWEAGLDRTLRALVDMQVSGMFIRDVPHHDQAIPACLSAMSSATLRLRSSCNTPMSRAIDTAQVAAETRILAQHPSIRLLSLTSEFCDNDVCYASYNGLPIYFDAHHLTASTARRLQFPIERLLLTIPAMQPLAASSMLDTIPRAWVGSPD